MNTELRKRLEEAAKKYAWSVWTNPMFLQEWNECKRDFIEGAELGYKEAIAQASEWWWENIDALFGHKITKDEFDNLITDFEADMSKLWEEKK